MAEGGGGGGLGDPEAHLAHTDRRASCPGPKASTAPRPSSKAVPRKGDTKGAGRAGRGVATAVSAADAAGPSCGAGGTAEALTGGCAWAGAGPGRGTGAGGGGHRRDASVLAWHTQDDTATCLWLRRVH